MPRSKTTRTSVLFLMDIIHPTIQ